jgi:hypothetical protein
MPRRKQAIDTLQGNHGHDRLSVITPDYADLNNDPPVYLHRYAKL